MSNATQVLDFNTVDDLAFAADRGRFNSSALPNMNAQDIGPFIELDLLADSGNLDSPYAASWLSLDGIAQLGKALETRRKQWICPRSRLTGIFRTSPYYALDATDLTGFGLAVQQAATAVGFPRRIAAQLAAAIGELHSNIHEHAQAPRTGIVAFRAHPHQIELVVADQGIGVLESLRGAAAYADLCDHGEALRLALSEGVSRYGSCENRGYGFRPLLVGLANLKGSLRFRSSDHALLIDGQHPSLMTARTAQKPYISGLFISIVCRLCGPLLVEIPPAPAVAVSP